MRIRKFICYTLIVISFLYLTSCGFVGNLSSLSVSTIKGWHFQYNEGTNDYSLFFGLTDNNGKYVSANANVDIRIEDEKNNIVYNGSKTVTPKDFSYYTSKAAGEQFLANVRIDKSEIEKGQSSNGTVYFIVKSDYFSFDECNCKALFCLPVRDITILFDLPIDISSKDYRGNIESKYSITNIEYNIDSSLSSSKANIILYGQKIYGANTGFSMGMFSYQLLDSNGYSVKTGTFILDRGLNVGDKFKEDSLTIYDLTPGETYTLKITSYR